MGGLQDLVALIRADTPLIVVETADEARTVDLFRQALRQVWRAMYRWSVTEGLRRFDLDREDPAGVAGDPAASLRAIYDLADLSASRFMSSTGQSGNALSPHYRDWTDKWAAVQFIQIGAQRRNPGGDSFETLVLQPARDRH